MGYGVKGKFYAQVEQLYLVTIDGWDRPYPFREAEIRPVQVQSEMPEKHKCNLSDADLIEACDKWVDKLCKSGGNAWSLSVPVNFNNDPDMLLSELIRRFKSRPLITPKQVTDEEIEAEWKRWELWRHGNTLEVFRKGVRWALQKSEGGEG